MIRKEKGLSQEQLAEASGISLRTIQRIEKGRVTPQPYTLKTLAESLDLEPSTFITQVDNASDESHSKIRLIILFSILMILPPLNNIIIPAIIWFRNRQSEDMRNFGSKIISFEILWTIATFVLLVLTPNITYILVGSSTPGSFSPLVVVYVIMIAFNLIVMFKAANQLSKHDHNFLPMIPRLF